MKRREFVTLIGGAVVWPIAARAQQKKTHRIGILSQDLQPGLLETFRDELRKRGYVEGTDISIELRNAEGHNERLPALAEELLKLNVDVIVAVNTPAAQAAKKATDTIFVVMMRVADPVRCLGGQPLPPRREYHGPEFHAGGPRAKFYGYLGIHVMFDISRVDWTVVQLARRRETGNEMAQNCFGQNSGGSDVD